MYDEMSVKLFEWRTLNRFSSCDIIKINKIFVKARAHIFAKARAHIFAKARSHIFAWCKKILIKSFWYYWETQFKFN